MFVVAMDLTVFVIYRLISFIKLNYFNLAWNELIESNFSPQINGLFSEEISLYGAVIITLTSGIILVFIYEIVQQNSLGTSTAV